MLTTFLESQAKSPAPRKLRTPLLYAAQCEAPLCATTPRLIERSNGFPRPTESLGPSNVCANGPSFIEIESARPSRYGSQSARSATANFSVRSDSSTSAAVMLLRPA